MLEEHEQRLKILEEARKRHMTEASPIQIIPSPAVKGMVKTAMVKEAVASVALDGETQTITPPITSENTPKTSDQVESKTKVSAEKKKK